MSKLMARKSKLIRPILADIEMDEEFVEIIDKYKDKELTPMMMDLKIQADRVVYVLNRTLAKLNLMVKESSGEIIRAYLPFLLAQDGEIVRKSFLSVDSYFILEAMNSYDARFTISKYGDVAFSTYVDTIERITMMGSKSSVSMSMSRLSSFVVEVDPQINQVVDMMFYNMCIKSAMTSAVEPHIDMTTRKFMRVILDFKQVAITCLFTTGDEQRVLDKLLRKTFKLNMLYLTTLKELRERLEKQRQELGDQLKETVELFETYNKKIEEIKEAIQIQHEKSTYESERIMMQKTLESEVIQEELAETANALTRRHQQQLEDHLDDEKRSRAQRVKLETQLVNWLQTYDQDIGERHAEFEEVQALYDEKKAEMDELTEKMENQQEEYETLMEEKRNEEERIFYEMAYTFLINRCARKIQRYWRAYRKRKLAKKKKGKGKKNKKEYKEKKVAVTRSGDFVAALDSDRRIKTHVFEDLKTESAVFVQESVPVDLNKL